MWDLPRPGLEPVSPALAGGFLTIAPPGKPELRDLESILQTSLPLYMLSPRENSEWQVLLPKILGPSSYILL